MIYNYFVLHKVKRFPDVILPACCPSCKEPGVLCQLPASGTIIVVNEKGTSKSNLQSCMCLSYQLNSTLKILFPFSEVCIYIDVYLFPFIYIVVVIINNI